MVSTVTLLEMALQASICLDQTGPSEQKCPWGWRWSLICRILKSRLNNDNYYFVQVCKANKLDEQWSLFWHQRPRPKINSIFFVLFKFLFSFKAVQARTYLEYEMPVYLKLATTLASAVAAAVFNPREKCEKAYFFFIFVDRCRIASSSSHSAEQERHKKWKQQQQQRP